MYTFFLQHCYCCCYRSQSSSTRSSRLWNRCLILQCYFCPCHCCCHGTKWSTDPSHLLLSATNNQLRRLAIRSVLIPLECYLVLWSPPRRGLLQNLHNYLHDTILKKHANADRDSMCGYHLRLQAEKIK